MGQLVKRGDPLGKVLKVIPSYRAKGSQAMSYALMTHDPPDYSYYHYLLYYTHILLQLLVQTIISIPIGIKELELHCKKQKSIIFFVY